jgi:dTDP-4-dehydrorhamnose reductase
MKCLLIGSSGLAGQAFQRECKKRNYECVSVARHDADILIDIRDQAALLELLNASHYDLVINSAAVVDIELCENKAEWTWPVNSGSVEILAKYSMKTDTPLIHISTDHYYNYGERQPHDEYSPIALLNNYAKQKFQAETFASSSSNSLVLRTSIVGIRAWGKPTLAEWAIDVVKNDRPVTLFHDSFSSSIDVDTFAYYALALNDAKQRGVLNLAAGEVYSKKEFVLEIAHQLGCELSRATVGSVGSLYPPRPKCLGLDVSKAESILGRPMPSLKKVVSNILDKQG